MKRFPAFLFALCLFSFACKRNTVNLAFTNARDQVPVLGNLVFRFSANLATDSMLNHWDSTAYISFQPAIRGQFRWEAKDQLVFSPAGPLLPATSYTASFSTKSLLAATDYNAIADAGSIKFRTPDLSLDRQAFIWTREEGSQAVIPVVELVFNYPVLPRSLESGMEIRVDDNPVQVEFETLSASPGIRARLRGVKAEDRDYKVAVMVKKGVIPEGGSNGLPANQEYNAILPSPFQLTINEITTEHDGSTGSIFVQTNQMISGTELGQFVSLSPSVKFTVERSDKGLLISSPAFGVDNSYTLTLKPGLRGDLGGVLKETYDAALAFGELEPSLGFTNGKAVYLSAAGEKNIEMRITNIKRIKLVVSKVYENNLLTANNYGYYPKETWDDEETYYYDDGGPVLGDVLYEQEIEVRSLPKYGNSRLLQFNPDDKLPGYKGVYHVLVRSMEDYWQSSSRFISLSDIGLIAKSGGNKMFVFANSIQSANPLSGVGVQVYGANNQLIGNGSTNSDGVAEITLQGQGSYSGFQPAMVVARLGDDFNYLPFNNTGVNTSRYAVGGKKINSTGLDAFVAPERDIYRPGETMHYAVVVRDANRKSPGALPVKMKINLPNGKELTQIRKTLDAEGVTEAQVPLPLTAITGTYTMELYNGNDVLITSYNFKVEEFTPDRINLTIKLDQGRLKPGSEANLSLSAVNYFGPAASGRNYEVLMEVKEKPFRPEAFIRYDFSLYNRSAFFDNKVRQGTTDERGMATELFTIPETYKNMGLLQARFFATVFDENGRPVSRNTTENLFTQDVLLGIGNTGYNYFPLNQPVNFPLIALSPQEKVVTAQAKISLIKHEYRTVLQKSGGYFRYQSQREEKLLQTKDISIQGTNTAFPFIPKAPGEYELRVTLPGSSTYVSRRFYSYGSWGSSIGDFEVNSDGQIDIVLDKQEYKKGESVKALFKAPFDGRMLVTIECADVISHQWVEVKNRAASASFLLSDAYLPNSYITATLFKPHRSGSNLPLTSAHGIANIAVKDEEKRIPVSISAAAKSRSEKRQRVTVKASAGSMVCLSAVDNGILAVTAFRTPDPYQWYFSKRALGVAAWDIYPLLFPELKRTLSQTGGDGDLTMDLRQNPFANKRFKLMSQWGGWKKAGGNGEVNFDIDIPMFNGQVRLMAVAVNGDRFGAAEATMQVADPLVLSTSMPRFLTPGDTVYASLNISNTTAKAATVSAKLNTEGPLAHGVTGDLSANIAPNAEGKLEFPVFASAIPGQGKLSITVTGLGESFKEVIDISVRPASGLQRRSGSGVLTGGEKKSVKMDVEDLMQESLQYSLVVGRSPVLQLGTPLRYLVNYPHGCTEQLISAAFPQIYFSELSKLMKESSGLNNAAAQNVQYAIQRIKMRQLYNGGLTMWDAEGTENWWVSAYAAHFLLEARKAGYAPDNSLLETLLQYLTTKLRKRDMVDYYYNQNQNRRIAPKEVAYSLYILALAGRPNVPAMNYYKANRKDLSLDSRYVLSATYALAGDNKAFREMLPTSFAGEEAVATGNGSLYSAIRDEALALNVLLEADPNNAQVPIMAQHLVQKLNRQTYFSTQEASFSLLALGKLAKQAGKNDATARVVANGKTLAVLSGDNLSLGKSKLGTSNLSIEAEGNGKLYYWWQANGISLAGKFVQEDNYLKVRRQLYDRYGREYTGNTFKQNDVVVVKLTLDKSFNGRLENVVVTDLLPGGWEIENARIRDLPDLKWVRDETVPLSRDVRDDRIHFFTDMTSNRQVFYYTVRAVTQGNYLIGPLSADAMYQGEYHSYSGVGRIKVQR